LRIEIDEVRGRGIAELPVHPSLFELVIERIGLANVMGIAELPDQIRSPQQRGLLVEFLFFARKA
jgi:hypothetical protein